jgi:hypothetical protein
MRPVNRTHVQGSALARTSAAICHDGRGMAEVVLEDGLARLHTYEAPAPSIPGDCLRAPYFREG